MLANLEVQKVIKQVAKAIAAVLDVEIIVVDKNYKIVGGTARHQGNYEISNNAIYKHIFRSGKPMVIESPGFHTLCQGCRLFQKCPETAEIDSPIILQKDIIGIISLVGLTTQHKEMMLSRWDEYLAFLARMGDLIASKVSEVDTLRKVTYMAQQLEHIMDSVYDGIIVTDEKGIITHCNIPAENLLKMKIPNILGKNINVVLPDSPFPSVLEEKISTINKEYYLRRRNNEVINCYIFANPIFHPDKEKLTGAIATIRDAREMNSFVSKILGYQKEFSFSDIKGDSLVMTQIKEQASKVAKSSSTILIRGPSGTGKELFARAIHHESQFHRGPFIAINCAAIPETLLESELFGYEDGAFTGAKKDGKVGKFELADKGTIFLDEIGDMPLYLQAKLLRVLQEKKIQRVGGIKEIPVLVRVLAATNQNLEDLVSEGRFRADLFYRLNVIPLYIPPLVERKEDISSIVQYLLDKYNSLFNKNVTSLDSDVEKLFFAYSWPGNVRELENVIEYAMNMEMGQVITYKNLPKYLKDKFNNPKITNNLSLKELMEKYEIDLLKEKITKYGNSLEGKVQIAAELEIGIATLYRKLKRYNML